MRKFLVTKLVCALCGKGVNLTTEFPGAGRSSPHCDGEPTGAERTETVVGVEPCICVTEPIHMALHGANELSGLLSRLEKLLKIQRITKEEKSDADRI